jgi:hypothetical protein
MRIYSLGSGILCAPTHPVLAVGADLKAPGDDGMESMTIRISEVSYRSLLRSRMQLSERLGRVVSWFYQLPMLCCVLRFR